jgi:hypothetical protein
LLRKMRLSVFPVEAAVTAVLVVPVPKVCLLLLVCIPLLVRELKWTPIVGPWIAGVKV